MIKLTTYIYEKLKINKSVQNKEELPTFEQFFDLLKTCGEIELKLIFGKNLPYDEKERDILSIYTSGDNILYSYQEPSVSYDLETRLDLDVFSNEQLLKIYNYMKKF